MRFAASVLLAAHWSVGSWPQFSNLSNVVIVLKPPPSLADVGGRCGKLWNRQAAIDAHRAGLEWAATSFKRGLLGK